MLTLSAGKSSLVLAPEYGAGVLGWMHGNVPILRRALPGAVMGDYHVMSAFPLAPYANRIGGGRFTWQGHDYQLALKPDQTNTIHGVARQHPWSVEQVSGSAVHLAFRHEGDADWPFAFDASLAYSLDETGLTVEMSLTNRHGSAAPAGFGIHPYFPKRHDATIAFDATGVWRNGENALPVQHGPIPPDWSFATPAPVTRSSLDNCFTGWSRTAQIEAGPASLRIEASEAFGNLQVFTPGWTDFFCVEPVTHVPDAVNRPDLPPEQAMATLPPNGTLAGTVRLTLTAPTG